MARGSVEADRRGTVVDVLAAVVPCPSVDTDTRVAALSVEAGASVVAGIGLQVTLVNIFCAELTCPLRCTLAVVGVHPIDAGSPMPTVVFGTIVNVNFTILSFKTWQAGTFVRQVASLPAGPSVLALGRGAGDVDAFALAPSEAGQALAVEGARGVGARPSVLAEVGHFAFVDVCAAVLAAETGGAAAVVAVVPVGAAGSIGTRARDTGIDLRAVHSSEPSRAAAGVLGHAIHHRTGAYSSVETRRPLARIGKLAQVPKVTGSTQARRIPVWTPDALSAVFTWTVVILTLQSFTQRRQ